MQMCKLASFAFPLRSDLGRPSAAHICAACALLHPSQVIYYFHTHASEVGTSFSTHNGSESELFLNAIQKANIERVKSGVRNVTIER